MPRTSPDPFEDFQTPPREQCAFVDMMDKLPDERRDALTRVLAMTQDEYSNHLIWRVLRHKWGVKVGPHTVADHRNGVCVCRK